VLSSEVYAVINYPVIF